MILEINVREQDLADAFAELSENEKVKILKKLLSDCEESTIDEIELFIERNL